MGIGVTGSEAVLVQGWITHATLLPVTYVMGGKRCSRYEERRLSGQIVRLFPAEQHPS